jgi:hypothetical protein
MAVGDTAGNTGEYLPCCTQRRKWKIIYHKTRRLHLRVPADKAGSLSNKI